MRMCWLGLPTVMYYCVPCLHSKKLCMRNEKLIFAVKTDCDGKESVYRAGGMCLCRKK